MVNPNEFRINSMANLRLVLGIVHESHFLPHVGHFLVRFLHGLGSVGRSVSNDLDRNSVLGNDEDPILPRLRVVEKSTATFLASHDLSLLGGQAIV